jgi:hypothetical protein
MGSAGVPEYAVAVAAAVVVVVAVAVAVAVAVGSSAAGTVRRRVNNASYCQLLCVVGLVMRSTG